MVPGGGVEPPWPRGPADFASSKYVRKYRIIYALESSNRELWKKMCKFQLFLQESAPAPTEAPWGIICTGIWGKERAGLIWWLEWDLNPHGIAPNGF